MGKVIGDSGQFELWLREFLPQLFDENFELAPGEVIDRQVSPTIGNNGFSRNSIFCYLLPLERLFECLFICVMHYNLKAEHCNSIEYADLDLRSQTLLTQEFVIFRRTDGKLVHLDGLNFSRAWSIYYIVLSLGEAATEDLHSNLLRIADAHILQSMDFVVGSDYAGSHWLASFLTHALLIREKAVNFIKTM